MLVVQANSVLLPLESVLSKDVAAMTDAIERERETKREISPIHGQAIYQSYSSRIREASQTLKPLVLPLMLSVKGLFSLLTRLARTASLHAGNLHKVSRCFTKTIVKEKLYVHPYIYIYISLPSYDMRIFYLRKR